MKQAVLIEDLQVDENHQLHIKIPADMGNQFKVIVLPTDPQNQNILDQDEAFMLAAYSAVIDEDLEEDAVWEKYIRD